MRRITACIIILIIIFAITGCGGEQELESVSDSRFLLDTLCSITIFAPDNRAALAEATELLEEAFALLQHYESLFSISIESSDVWRINHANGAPTVVSPETIKILEAGIEYGRLSGGTFDITIGRLTSLWDFSGNAGIPNESDLMQAVMTVGYQNIIIEENTVTLTNPEAWIDLGGIAKGFIQDSLSDFMIEHGVRGAVIDLGGDVTVVGARGENRLWRLGVRHPFGGELGLLGVIEIPEAASMTSGIYQRQFELDGIAYHHILDPKTGMPTNSDIASATIVINSALIGDALTSVVVQAGSERGAELIEETPGVLGAILVLRSGEIIVIGDIAFELIEA